MVWQARRPKSHLMWHWVKLSIQLSHGDSFRVDCFEDDFLIFLVTSHVKVGHGFCHGVHYGGFTAERLPNQHKTGTGKNKSAEK